MPDDEDPEVIEILFEGDANQRPRDFGWSNDPDSELEPHPTRVVGNDRLAALVFAVSDNVAELRAQQRAETSGGGATGSAMATVFPEKTAQVVQATQTPLDLVLALLAGGVVDESSKRLTLDDAVTPTIADGVASFAGRLRLRRPPGRRLVDLRVYPTASHNLTVLELLPKRPWMAQTDRYLAAGVPAITELTDAIEAAAAAATREEAP